MFHFKQSATTHQQTQLKIHEPQTYLYYYEIRIMQTNWHNNKWPVCYNYVHSVTSEPVKYVWKQTTCGVIGDMYIYKIFIILPLHDLKLIAEWPHIVIGVDSLKYAVVPSKYASRCSTTAVWPNDEHSAVIMGKIYFIRGFSLEFHVLRE